MTWESERTQQRKARQAEAILAGDSCEKCGHRDRVQPRPQNCPWRALSRDPLPNWCENFARVRNP